MFCYSALRTPAKAMCSCWESRFPQWAQPRLVKHTLLRQALHWGGGTCSAEKCSSESSPSLAQLSLLLVTSQQVRQVGFQVFPNKWKNFLSCSHFFSPRGFIEKKRRYINLLKVGWICFYFGSWGLALINAVNSSSFAVIKDKANQHCS